MRNLLKSVGVGGAGGVFVRACEQKELRDVVSHVIGGSGDEFGGVRTVSCVPRRKHSQPLYERPPFCSFYYTVPIYRHVKWHIINNVIYF